MNPKYQRNITTILPTDTALTVHRLLKDKRALAVICLVLPPLAVFLKTGMSRKFGLSLLLFAFFIFPGIIYGFYVTFLESALDPAFQNSEV